MKRYKSIFISDVHLGTRGSQADRLVSYLKSVECENLFLVGDIVDGWRLRRKWYFPQSHVNVVHTILKMSKKGTRVYYIIGNHDEVLRNFLSYEPSFGRITISDRETYTAINGKRYLVIHGDFFDALMVNRKWLMHFGDAAYNFMIWFNLHLNKLRKVLGLQYWSLSNWLKQNTKQALNFIHSYENHVAKYCYDNGYDGIICGHIHVPEIRIVNGIEYMNDGDWVETCSALVEEYDGSFKIIHVSEDFC